MTSLLWLLPIISIILGIVILYKGVSDFLKKSQNGYIYFCFLFIFIIIFLLHFIIISLVIWYQTLNITNLEEQIIISNLLIIGVPILGSCIGIGLLGKYLFEFISFVISYGNKLNNFSRYLKMFLFIIFTGVILFLINISVTYGLIIYFKMIYLGGLLLNNIYITNSILIGLSGFGYSIGLALLISGFFIYIKKVFNKQNITLSKKILYSIGCFVGFILLYSIIHLGILFSMIVIFKLITGSIELNNLNIGLLLGLSSLVAGLLQGYSFLDYQKNIRKIYIPILVFILSNICLLLSLIYSFKVLN